MLGVHLGMGAPLAALANKYNPLSTMLRRSSSTSESVDKSRRSFLKGVGTAAATGGLAATGLSSLSAEAAPAERPKVATAPLDKKIPRVLGDPTDIPPPIERNTPKAHDLTLEAEEVTAQIEPGVTFNFMTYSGQVPGPMVRVRQGDTINLTFKNPSENSLPHNVDFHAVYGPGGGAVDTMTAPGGTSKITFRAMYPGAFIYHCAIPNLDYHISSGMFGMILVEPPEGLPPVDREFYVGQHEVYTSDKPDANGHLAFDFDRMSAENPSYVLFNGRKNGLTQDEFGPMSAKVGETTRVFMVTGGPNLTSSFHPIGNVFTEAWREGAVTSSAENYIQTIPVAPGSCGVFHMDMPVPGPVFLVDHALSRVARKGAKATIQVDGDPQPDVFNPNPA